MTCNLFKKLILPYLHIFITGSFLTMSSPCAEAGAASTMTGGGEELSEDQESFMISNDMSNLRVTAIAEDDCGHIWLGTFRGLNKYTGQEYHQYFCSNDSLSIPDNQIQSMLKDSRGRLWIGTVNGIAEYTRQDNFRRYTTRNVADNNIIQILESPSGAIFINTIATLRVLNEETGIFEIILPELTSGHAYNDRCFFSPDGNLWIANSHSVRCFSVQPAGVPDDGPSGEAPVRASLIYSKEVPGQPRTFHMTQDGKLILCGKGQIQIFDTFRRDFVKIPDKVRQDGRFSKAHISLIHPYGDRGLLLKSDKHGVFLYDMEKGLLLHQDDGNFPFEVPDFRINAFFSDSQDNLWIGSYDQGYTAVYSYKSRFNSNNFLRRATENKSIMAMARDGEGRIFFATLNDGLMMYNPENDKIINIDRGSIFSYEGGEQTDINALHIDSKGYIWVGGMFAVARCRYSGNGKLNVLDSYGSFYPLSITEDRAGNIWVSSVSSALLRIDGKTYEETVLPAVTSGYTFIPALLPLGDKVLVAGFGQPLMLASPDSDKLVPAPVVEEDWEKCIRRSLFIPTKMAQDRHGMVWIGTVANGLLLYDPQTGHISPVKGTPCTDISSIEEDEYGNIWVSTQYGLGKYDRTGKKFINWFASDGTGGNQFYDRSSCTLPDGNIIFGGTHGMTCFNPTDVSLRSEVPVFFENLKVHNTTMRPGRDICTDESLPYSSSIRLEYDQNSFSISFAALDYGEYERVHYFYRLDGFDKHWIDAHNNREAYYANLPYGKYELKVRVTNYDQTIVQGENSISITVRPPWWLSWWACTIYTLFACCCVGVIIRTRLKILHEKAAKVAAEEEKEREKKMNKMHMTYFANISHEFRTPLTMISGPVMQLSEAEEITPEHKRLLDIVARNIRRMLRLVNQLLDFHKLENKDLMVQSREYDLIPMLQYLTEIFSVSAKEKGLKFQTYGIEDSFKVCGDADKMDKICSNLLSNALKYTSAGGTVEFCLDIISLDEAKRLSGAAFGSGTVIEEKYRRWIKIQVKDTGTGIPEEALEKIFERYYQVEKIDGGDYNWGTGIGLYYARSLAGLCHGKLWAANRTECRGAVFTLLIPSELEAAKASSPETEPSFNLSGNSAIIYKEQEERADEDSYTILVVDDDVDVAYYLRELLSPHYKVVVRFDADSAYTAMKEELPDIVISDVVMPGKDGYEFSREVKNDIQLSHVPIILLTAKASVENQVEGLDCGADAYVTKPFEPKYLLALAGSLLGNREKIRRILGQSTAMEESASQALTPQDGAFMEEFYKLMEKELCNAELDIASMTEMLHISRTKFYYKVKGLTGYNPGAFFKRYKLNRAAELLKERKYNISEIADLTGFSTLSHFSVSFKKQFGVSPSEYVK